MSDAWSDKIFMPVAWFEMSRMTSQNMVEKENSPFKMSKTFQKQKFDGLIFKFVSGPIFISTLLFTYC